MLQLPDPWRRYFWLGVSALIVGISYWMFFSGTGNGRH
jgi:hypothetical protein